MQDVSLASSMWLSWRERCMQRPQCTFLVGALYFSTAFFFAAGSGAAPSASETPLSLFLAPVLRFLLAGVFDVEGDIFARVPASAG